MQISSRFYLIARTPLMTLFIFKYCLPALLGYILFVGIAGRLNPLSKPFHPEERPSWLLGVWTGLSVFIVLSVGLHMAYGMSLEGARALAIPSAWFMAALLVPGFITYFVYRRYVNRQLAGSSASSFDWSKQEDDLDFRADLEASTVFQNGDDPLDSDMDPRSLDDMDIPEEEGPVIAAFLDSADLGTVDTHGFPQPVNDAPETASESADRPLSAGDVEVFADNPMANDIADEESDFLDMTQFVTAADVDDLANADIDDQQEGTLAQQDSDTGSDTIFIEPSEPSEPSEPPESSELSESSELTPGASVAEDREQAMTPDAQESIVAEPVDGPETEPLASSEQVDNAENDILSDAAIETDTEFHSDFSTDDSAALEEEVDVEAKAKAEELVAAIAIARQEADVLAQEQSTEIAALQEALRAENARRVETEKHLRITRKALATMESETRDYESRKADSIIALEDQLAQSISSQSEFERLATTEKSKRISLETTVVNLKQDLVKVKHDVRRSIAARAKALSTANKSIAFARQAVQTRARLESELAAAQETLDNRQATVSSLIRALEKEKRRTEDDIASLAKQYVLREKQMQARKSLEQVARSVENKLTTRLVKKVAKARPAVSESKD